MRESETSVKLFTCILRACIVVLKKHMSFFQVSLYGQKIKIHRGSIGISHNTNHHPRKNPCVN